MDDGLLFYGRKGEPPQIYQLLRRVNTIGRDPSNDLVLDDDRVSPQHAHISYAPNGRFQVRDLRSKNGTVLNNVLLEPMVYRALQDGDGLTIGPFVVRYLQPTEEKAPSVLPPQPEITRVQAKSSYLQYLPPSYHSDGNPLPPDVVSVDDFLLIFESILGPIEGMIDQLYRYFDPWLAPEKMLPWLATWVDLVLNENWTVEQRRRLIKAAPELYSWRGTQRGMKAYLQIYLGETAHITIIEPWQVTQEEGKTSLAPNAFRVVINPTGPVAIDHVLVAAIVESAKPAHTLPEIIYPEN